MIKKIITTIAISTGVFAQGALTLSPMDSLMKQTTSQSQESGIEKKKTYSELIAFLEKSTNGQYVLSLAVIYLNGISDPDMEGNTVSPNTKKAIKYFKKAINLEYYESSAILGSLYLFDDRFTKEKDNVKKGKHYLEIAVNKGIYSATVALSNIYFYYERDATNGLKYLYLGAKHNLATAELSLATLFAYGSKELDIDKNLVIANKYLEKACLNKEKTKKVEEFCSSKYVLNYKNDEVN